MVDFFDRLRNDRKLEESLRLAVGIQDAELKSRLHTLLSLSFAEIEPTNGFLSSMLGIRDPGAAPPPEAPPRLTEDKYMNRVGLPRGVAKRVTPNMALQPTGQKAARR